MSINFTDLEKAVLEQINVTQEMSKEDLTNYFASVGLLAALYQNKAQTIAVLFDQVSKLLIEKSQEEKEKDADITEAG